jgi:ATP-dependent DNA helicase RecG
MAWMRGSQMIRRLQPTLQSEEVAAHLVAGASDRVAFVPAKTTTRLLADTLAALATANGGLALLGVSSKGTEQSEIDDNALRDAATAAGLLTDPPLVLPSAQVITVAQGPVVVVQVPAGLPHIYSLQGMYLTRTGGQNRPLTTPELRRLLLERGDAGYEAQLVPNATMADLDEQRILRYLDQVAFSATEDITQALLARGCVAYAEPVLGTTPVVMPTVAGILLFGRAPQQFIRSAEIICVRYAGAEMSDEFVRQDISGTLVEQIRQAEAFVFSNMRREMRINGLAREDSAEYPLAVVREAIVNAVCHRDYSIRGEGIRLLMYSNRLEVYSPGRLPGHVTLHNLKDERYSRNEAVVAVLSDMGYIERLGYGIDRMISTMSENGLSAPHFEETAAGFKVTLESAAMEQPGGYTAFPSAKSPVLSPSFLAQTPLTERQQQALAFIQTNGRITNSDYQALAPDVSPETIRRDLADLVEKNLLLRIGEKRATYYILK